MSERRATKGSRAVVYVRVSKREQETLRDQEQRCRAFCKSQGWTVVDVVSDRGISAWSGKDRPGWLRVEGMVDRHEVDAVVVFQVSRAARNVGRLHAFMERCRDAGVVFATASDGVNTSTPMGRLMATIVGALAELESEIRSERTLIGLDRVREEGKYTGGRPPYGFTIDASGMLVEDERQGKLVREAATRFLADEGLRTIAEDWTRRKIKTPRAGEKLKHTGRWSGTTIHDVLANPAHEGRTLMHRDFERVQRKLDEQANNVGPRGDKYMLTGVLRCGVCDAPMVGQPRQGLRRYICNKGPHDTVIRADVVEEIVTRRASGAWRKVEGVKDPAKVGKELLARLSKAEEELLEAARDAGQQGLRGGELKAYLQPLRDKRDALEREVEESGQAKPWSFQELLKDVPKPTPIEWRAQVEEVVDHVKIGPRVVDGVRAPSVEDRVLIEWREGVKLEGDMRPPRRRKK